MKKILIIAIAAIIICAAFFIPVGQSNQITSSFGEWKLEIVGVDSDGKEIPFAVKTNTAQLLSFSYNGKPIDTVKYRLFAKATGSGFTSCELDLSDVESDGIVYQTPSSTNGYRYIWDDVTGTNSMSIPLNSGYEKVFERSYCLGNLDDVPDGSYQMQVRYRGDVRFRGLGSTNGDWATENIQLDSIIDLSNDGDDDGGSGGGGGSDDPTLYTVTILTVPLAEWVTCSQKDFVGPPEKIYGTEVASGTVSGFRFQRPSGGYTINAFFPSIGSNGRTATTQIVVNNGPVTRSILGYMLEITSLSFTVEAFNDVNAYQMSDGYYLGG